MRGMRDFICQSETQTVSASQRNSLCTLQMVGLLGLLASSSATHAHSTWANGVPIPEWVTKACCGPGDAHHLQPAQVHRVDGGYRIDGYPKVIYDVQVLPSEDGEFWAFYAVSTSESGERLFTNVFCFFAPASG